MPMLHLGGGPFSQGRADFLDAPPTLTDRSARVYVRIGFPEGTGTFLALLDTGAEWSVLDPELADELGIADLDGQAISLRHKDGTTPGKLVRTTLTMLADEGDALDVEATVFVPTQPWPAGRNFLGYSGFLEKIRLGLDPQNNHIYFATG